MALIYENIVRLCAERGISVRALEKAVGLGNGVIGAWRRKSPRVDKLLRVADFFGVTLDELVRGDRQEGGKTT